ncbi:hypothetical protein F4775DRAFT_550657 [Biscogniauxia sp. FL1348]|nr:hypothetical protein F4775DRAFT_550657 [Biscogniauxia sp. FL1348]
MPPKKEQSMELTENETRIMGLAWRCFTSQPEIDWQKLADMGGYKNHRSCQNILAGAKKKLAAASANLGSVKAGRPAGGGRKRKATAEAVAKDDDDDDDNSDGDDDGPSPAKKAKKTTAALKTAARSAHADDDDDRLDQDERETQVKGIIKLEETDDTI